MNQIDTQQLINFLLSQQQSEKSMEINTCYKIFMNHLSIHNRAGTIHAYESALKPLLKYLDRNKIITTAQLNNAVIDKFVLWRKPIVKPVTINKEVKSLEIMLRLMIRYNYIDKINFKFTALKTVKTNIDKISKESIEKIIKYFETANVEKNNKLMFLLILTTGIRTSEVINIKNKNIDLVNNVIKLDFTKNGEPRNIYIIDQVKPLLEATMNSKEYLFYDSHGNQMTANGVRKFFKRLKDTLNIKILSPHKLRHYYATTIYKKSLDLYLVKDLLGHKSLTMTQIYLDIDHKENQLRNSTYNPLNDFLPTH